MWWNCVRLVSFTACLLHFVPSHTSSKSLSSMLLAKWDMSILEYKIQSVWSLLINVFEGANIWLGIPFFFVIFLKMSVETGKFQQRFGLNAKSEHNETNWFHVKSNPFELGGDTSYSPTRERERNTSTLTAKCLEMRLGRNELMASERD